MTKQRWIKVSISYNEGDDLNAWSSTTLGDTSLVLVIEGTGNGQFVDLEATVGTAVHELIRRSERLVPLELTPVTT